MAMRRAPVEKWPKKWCILTWRRTWKSRLAAESLGISDTKSPGLSTAYTLGTSVEHIILGTVLWTHGDR